MKWKWKGPLEGGITQSMIQKYLHDPYTFVIYYGLGLEVPTQYNQNLLWGNMMHRGLEIGLVRSEPIKEILPEIRGELAVEQKKWPYIASSTIESVCEMLKLYNDSFKYSLENIRTEQQFKVEHRTKNHKVTLMGKVDMLAHDPTTGSLVLGEHKCKGSYDKQLFRQEFHTDLQLNIYCHCNEVYDFIYDNILIPEDQWNCPPRDVHERVEFWIQRLYHKQNYGSYPVAKKSFAWLDQLRDQLVPEEVQTYFKRTVNPAIDSICHLYDYCESDSFDPTNPDHYNSLFYEKPLRAFDPARTAKFKADNWEHRVGLIPLESLVPTEQLFKELEGEG